ncbi:MAG: flagellar filament outer layer protein FlaA, partial [Treponema sp.]|nr:flagellar filament outer layer protein FlaA [Treponema sp.]
MKHGSFKVICLFVLACITVLSTYGDEVTVDLESKVLEAFNGDSEYTWRTDASKFATKTNDGNYPQLTYVDAWPIAAFGKNRDGQTLKSLGLHGRFDRQGYNWIDLYPVKTGDTGDNPAPAEIPMPGRIRNLDLWVWGANLHLYIEAYVRDYRGVVHIIRMGDVSYTGWKNLRANVPNHIRQAKRILPSLAGLTFVKFRIWTQPIEQVGDFYVY